VRQINEAIMSSAGELKLTELLGALTMEPIEVRSNSKNRMVTTNQALILKKSKIGIVKSWGVSKCLLSWLSNLG
jgi:hypothetical protein